MTYYVGQRVNVATQITDSTGAPSDATVTLTLTAPDGTVSTPAISHPGTGQYNADVTLDQPGDWLHVWSATGTVVTTEAGQWHVIAPTLMIVGLAEVKEHGNITGTASDRELLDFINTAGQLIEHQVGAVVPTTVTAERHPAGRTRVWLDHRPVLSVTSVQEYNGSTLTGALTASDWVLDGPTGVLSRIGPGGAPAHYLGTEVVVTYRAGRAPIPDAIRWAAKELTIHLWRATQAQRAGRGRSTAVDSDNSVTALGYALPNRVIDALMPFLKPPAVY